MSTQYAVRATALHKAYGSDKVLRGIDLELPRGSVLALLGPNGAGKTTTIRILSTLIRADAGHASVAGFDVKGERREVRRRISLTGQYAAVDELQTGEENLRMIGALRGLRGASARARSFELLERFDLLGAGGRRVGEYSGGMRRKLDLALSLVGSPEVIFLDEPTTGLDPRSRQTMLDVVRELTATGVAVLLTTQYLEEADQLADSVAVLGSGEIVATGTPRELKDQVGERRLVLRFTSADELSDAAFALGQRVLDLHASELELSVAIDGSASNIRALLDEVDPERSRIAHFAVVSATLDDVFLAMTETANHATELEAMPCLNR